MRRDPFSAILARDGVVLLDGGMATQLEADGHDLSDRLWSARLLATDPEAIVAVHLAYFRAGAQVATTASYQASVEGFVAAGATHERARALVASSVDLAIEARRRFLDERAPDDPGPLLVAASVGPYGAVQADGSEYRGRYGLDVAALQAFHRPRMEILAAAGPDMLACETIPELAEGRALAALLAGMPDAAAWLSFSCADGAHLRSGEPVEEAFALADQTPAVVAVGVNCTAPEHIDELLARAAATTCLPLIVYPNSGEGWDPAARAWTGDPRQRVDAPAARRWVAAGARVVGGCCRVGPDQIRAIAAGLTGRG